jgi:thymidylate kinase
MMMKIVIFEGPDRAGKSTLLQEFRKRTDYQYLLFDRFTGSGVVYDEIYRRPFSDYYKTEKYLDSIPNIPVLLVVCIASEEELFKRADNTGEKTDRNQMRTARRKFIQYFKDSKFRHKILIDTTGKPVEDYVEKVIRLVERI